MRLTPSRAFTLAIVLQLGLEWSSWELATTGRAARWMPPVFIFGRALLAAGVAIVGVGAGRRWSAPLLSLGAALAAGVLWALGGIMTGQFLARGFGPAMVLGWLVWLLLLCIVSASVGAVVALLNARRQRAVTVAG